MRGLKPDGLREQPYRALLTLDANPSALDRVRDQLSAWMREKQWDVDLSIEGVQHDGNREFMLAGHDSSEGQSIRARLTERHPSTGVWRTELTVHVPARGEGWLLLDVSNDQGRFVDVPRLARYLVGAIDVRDGGDLQLTASPAVYAGSQSEHLAELVTALGRNGIIFVAGTDNALSFDAFRARLARWTRQVLGQAETILLDPAATIGFSAAMGSTHGVRPWTVRTYLPDVDPALMEDSLRHRFLTAERLGNAHDAEIARLLGRVTRRHSANRSLPRAVSRVGHALSRVENGYLVRAVHPEPVSPAQTITEDDVASVHEIATVSGARPRNLDQAASGHALSTIQMVKTILGLQELAEAPLREIVRRSQTSINAGALEQVRIQLQEQQGQIDQLELDVGTLREELEEEELEHALTDEARTRLQDEVRWLRSRLSTAEDYEAAISPVPLSEVTEYPASYIDLLDRLSGLEPAGVTYTGAHRVCRELDVVDSLGKTTRTAWESLLVLSDYVRARGDGAWQQGVHEYLKRTPDGYRGMTPRKHAATESEGTMNRFGAQRNFPVPTSCSASGTSTMTAHFKLGHIGMVSPRLYYLDDFTMSGRIYVGYIGRHLTNIQTN